MYIKIIALLVMIEEGNLDIEKAKTLLESIMEQLEAEGNEEALAIAKKAYEKIHEYRDKDSGLMDAMESLGRHLIDQDRIPIEKFLVQQHAKQGFRLEDIHRYRDDGIMTTHQTLLYKIFVWLKTPDKTINEVCFLDENKRPKVVDLKGLVDTTAAEESQFKAIREELRTMGI